MATETEYTFPDVTKDPGDDKPVTLNLFKYCANIWRANEQFDLNEYVRPRRGTGFAYQATAFAGAGSAGTSSAREPVWPRMLSATVVDGPITWTCVAAGTNGISPLSSPTATPDPSGMSISGVSVSESCKLLATYSGGTLDHDHDAVFSFSLNGVTRIARQKVKIRKR